MSGVADVGDQLRTVVLAAGVGVAGLVAGGGLTLAAGAVVNGIGVDLGLAALLVITLLLTQGVGFGGVALAYLSYRGLGLGFVGVRVPSLRDLAWASGGYVLAFVAAGIGIAVVVSTGAPAAQNRVSELAVREPAILLVLVPMSFLLIGPGEELLFRGIVQGTLRERFGPVGAVTIASAIFAAVHFVALSGGTGGRIVTVGVLFLPSLVFGTAYERTRNLVVPSLIHGAYNATLFTLLYISLQYGAGTTA